MSLIHPNSHLLLTAVFIQDVLFGLFQQSRKPYHLLKILILLRRTARLKPDNFSKSKPNPSPINKFEAKEQRNCRVRRFLHEQETCARLLAAIFLCV